MFGFGMSGDPCRAWHKFQQLRDPLANNSTPHKHKMSAAIIDDGDEGKKRDWLGVEDSEGEENAVSEEEQEEEGRVKGISRAAKRRKVDHASDNEDDSGEGGEEEAVGEIDEVPKGKKGKGKKSKDSKENDDELLFTNPNKLKPLTQDELAASKLATSKTGVIYLSRIPVYPHPL